MKILILKTWLSKIVFIFRSTSWYFY